MDDADSPLRDDRRMTGNLTSEAAIAAALEASTKAIYAALEATQIAAAAALTASTESAQALSAARSKVWWQLTMQAVVWLALALLAYGTVNTRLQVLEVRYDRMTQDIGEMKMDIKELLRISQKGG